MGNEMSQRVKLASSAFRVEDKFGWNPLQAFEPMFLGIYPREQLLGISPKKAVPRNYPREPIQILRIVENRTMYFELLF